MPCAFVSEICVQTAKILKYKELYLQCNSMKQVVLQGKDWYKDKAIGINTISSTVKRLVFSVGLQGYYTNHSLRHTCASFLYNDTENVPEQVIAEQTGHRSLAIRNYKHTKQDLKRKVRKILTDGPSATVTSSALSIQMFLFLRIVN